MINDQQSLILCGVMAAGIFIGGILDILNNFVILTILTLVFVTILVNLFFLRKNPEKEEKQNNTKTKNS